MNGNNYYSLFEEEIEYKDTKEKIRVPVGWYMIFSKCSFETFLPGYWYYIY